MTVEAGYKQTDVGVIPEDWESITVGEIASPVRNAIVGGPFGSDLVSDDYVEQGVPVIRGQNLGGRHISGSFVFVTPAKADSLEANIARSDDLVFTQRGTLGQVGLVPDQPFGRYLVSQSQMKLTVNRKAADPAFFYYVFSSAEQQEVIRQNTIQTGVPHINLGILRSIAIQRPPLAEQEAISEALSDADALIESLEQLLAKKRQIKQGAMQELLTGIVSTDWEAQLLGDVATLQRGFDLPHRLRKPGEIPIVTSSGIEDTHCEAKVEAPGVVTGRYGTIGEVFFVRDDFWPLNTTLYVRDFHGNDPLFVSYLLRTIDFHTHSGKSGVPGVNRNDLHEIVVALPPTKAEQTAIATILSDMDAEISALEAKLAKARQVKQGMMQELLTGRIRLVEN